MHLTYMEHSISPPTEGDYIRSVVLLLVNTLDEFCGHRQNDNDVIKLFLTQVYNLSSSSCCSRSGTWIRETYLLVVCLIMFPHARYRVFLWLLWFQIWIIIKRISLPFSLARRQFLKTCHLEICCELLLKSRILMLTGP